jgi:hypothetical protein
MKPSGVESGIEQFPDFFAQFGEFGVFARLESELSGLVQRGGNADAGDGFRKIRKRAMANSRSARRRIGPARRARAMAAGTVSAFQGHEPTVSMPWSRAPGTF